MSANDTENNEPTQGPTLFLARSDDATLNVSFVRLPQPFDFELPPQKHLLAFESAAPADARDDGPILLASNDPTFLPVASLTDEVRKQNDARGNDVTPTTNPGGSFVPFAVTASPARPDIKHDHGFLDDGNGNIDDSKRQSPTAADYAAKAKWFAKLVGAEQLRPDLVDATGAYRHFLMGNGEERPLSYERYIAGDRAGARTLESAIEDTRAAAIELHDKMNGGPMTFQIQSQGVGCGGGNGRYPYPGTENWQKAIGAHSIWLEANVVVTEEKTGWGATERVFAIDMTLHVEDRYNFNPGNADIVTGTPDADNGRFEVTGLGHEFMSVATSKRTIAFSLPIGTAPDVRVQPSDQKVTKPR